MHKLFLKTTNLQNKHFLLILVIGFFFIFYFQLNQNNNNFEEKLKYENFSYINRDVAKKLENEVKVLCWIMTNPENHKSKAIHIKKTWGSRCNKLLFMSTEKDEELESIALNVQEGRDNLWRKTKEAFRYIYNHHLNEADWFLKADDDTYVVLENLRLMLYPHNPDTPIYFGHRFKKYIKQGYMSGGAGYVLSREAVKRFAEKGLLSDDYCKDSEMPEDLEMGRCLEKVNVVAGDSRDLNRRGKFFPFTPEYHTAPEQNETDFWYTNFTYYEIDKGPECCSNYAVTFHYIEPNQMYAMDYLIYQLHPYGIVINSEPLPTKISENVDVSSAMNETDHRPPITDEY